MEKNAKLELLKQVLGAYQKVGKEYLFTCPKQSCNHHKQKLSVNIEKNVFKCWICDYRGNNLKRLVKHFGSFLQKQKWAEIVGEVDLSVSIDNLFHIEIEKKQDETISLPKEFISLCNEDLPLSAISPKKYLKSRGISKEQILKWKIGYCREGEYKDRILIPSFNNQGKVNYFVARTFSKHWRSYMNPNMSKDICFNELYVDWNSDIVLVEGVFDAIKAENAIPLLGSSLREDSKLFQEILRHDSTVFLALDSDAEKKTFD